MPLEGLIMVGAYRILAFHAAGEHLYARVGEVLKEARILPDLNLLRSSDDSAIRQHLEWAGLNFSGRGLIPKDKRRIFVFNSSLVVIAGWEGDAFRCDIILSDSTGDVVSSLTENLSGLKGSFVVFPLEDRGSVVRV